jgi:hypothetical protein
MIAIATALQTFVHPGIFFPFLCRRKEKNEKKNNSDVASHGGTSEDSVGKSAV